jgi:hypothetical protein
MGTGVAGAPGRLRLTAERRRSLGSAWGAFWISRLIVWVSGMAGVLISDAGAYRELNPGAQNPADSLTGLLLSPARRWDSGWFLSVALGGYDVPEPRTAFFPLYPLLIRVVGEPIDALGLAGAHAFEVAGIVVSLVSFMAALYLLHRLVTLELGTAAADASVLLLALFPASFYFSAIYSESLFLALSVGCLYAARRGWWWQAGSLGALASATRSQGVLLLLPLAVMAWQGRGSWRALLLVPSGLLAYLAFIKATTSHGVLAPFTSQEHWEREFRGPLVAVWNGIDSGIAAARDLLRGMGPHAPVSSVRSGLVNLAALTFGVAGAAGALRRLPLAYGAYALAGLVVAISYPLDADPLKSLPRFLLVLFPIFMWAGAAAIARRSLRSAALAVSAVGLAGFSAAFASGYWIA